MPSKKDLLVGQLALEREYITEGQLSEALRIQSELSEAGVRHDLVQVLVSSGHVTQVQAEKLEGALLAGRLEPAPARREAVRGPAARAAKGTRARPAVRTRPPTGPMQRVRGGADYAQADKSGQRLMIGIAAGAVVLMAGVVAFFTWNHEEPEDSGAGSVPPLPAPAVSAPAGRPVLEPPDGGERVGVRRSPRDLVPPGDAAKNVLPNGSFDELSHGSFKRWRVKNGRITITVDRKSGNVWCQFPEGGGYVEQKIRLEPEWAELRVSAVMKCEELEFGEGPDDTFRVGLHFEDADGNVVAEAEKVPELIEDADWVDVWAEVPVPRDRNARYLVLKAGNFGASGVCGIDEIRVVPQRTVPQRAAAPATTPAARPGPKAANKLLDKFLDGEPAGERPREPAGAAATEEPLAPEAGTDERDAFLGEFLALMMQSRHRAAEELARKAAGESALAAHAAAFKAAARAARALGMRLVHVQGKMRVMAGTEMKLQTTEGPQEGKVVGADVEGIHLAEDIVRNRQVVGQIERTVRWPDLTPEEMKRLSADWKPDDADGYVALAILAAGGEEKDLDAVADALEHAGDNPLMDWIIRLTEE